MRMGGDGVRERGRRQRNCERGSKSWRGEKRLNRKLEAEQRKERHG